MSSQIIGIEKQRIKEKLPVKHIGVIQIVQETCSFNPIQTRISDFKQYGLALGHEVIRKYGSIDEIGGFVKGLKRKKNSNIEIVGLIRAQAWSSGPLSIRALNFFKKSLEQSFASYPIDGLLMALHGAQTSVNELDVTAAFLEMAREKLGQNIPIVASCDLHANITRRMRKAADVIIGYKTAPHLDRRKTGEKAAAILMEIMERKRKFISYHCKIPMITATEKHNTFHGPLSYLFRRAASLAHSKEVIDISVFATQPWVDAPELGWSVLVTVKKDQNKAKSIAGKLAAEAWALRSKMNAHRLNADAAVQKALSMKGRPIIIADGADATNSGAPGDSVHLIKAFLSQSIPGGALSMMVDPETVKKAKAKGVGRILHTKIGGKRDTLFSSPLQIKGRMIQIKRVQYQLSGHGGNSHIDMGMGAVLKCNDLTLLVIERTGPGSTPLLYRCMGLEPKDFKMVVVKSPAGFRSDYALISKKIILSDCPGCALPHFEKLPYQHISRPLWPLSKITDWRKVEWLSRQC